MDRKIVDEYLDYYKALVAKNINQKNIVLFQNGMFYEIYNFRQPDGPNIEEMGDLLGIQIARRNKENPEVNHSNYEFVGFPIHAKQKFINILLNEGYTIAVYNQDEMGKKGVNRVLEQILSPTITLDYHNQYENNYLMCVYLEPHFNQRDQFYVCAFSIIDITVGNNYVYETSSRAGDFSYGIDQLYQNIKVFNPREVVFYMNPQYVGDRVGDWYYSKERLATDLELDIDGRVWHFRDSVLPADLFKASYQNAFLGEVFKTRGMLTPIETLDLERFPNAVVSYLLLLQFAKDHRQDIIQHICRPQILDNEEHLLLTQNSIYQLNIVPDKNQVISKNMSLLTILNNCSTAFGKRIFKERLLNPITDVAKLQRNYEQIEDVRYMWGDLESILSKITDIERLNRKLSLGVLTPGELYTMDQSLDHVQETVDFVCEKLPNWFGPSEQTLLEQFKGFRADYRSKIDTSSLYRYNAQRGIERSIFIRGVSPEIDTLDDEISCIHEAIDDLARALDSYIPNKKDEKCLVNVCQNDRDGFYLEMTLLRSEGMKNALGMKPIKINVGKNDTQKSYELTQMDLQFQKISSSSKNVRITGRQFKRWNEKLAENTKKISVLSTELYRSILSSLSDEYYNDISRLISLIGHIDCIKTHARNAVKMNLVRPSISTETDSKKSFVSLKGLRHPIVEAVQPNVPFISNDISLGLNQTDMMLCYGYNAVGKTTMQKAICIAIIMAQCGGFVSAGEMEFSPYRSIFTRISNVDNLLKNQSSFMVEMMELKYIIKHADKRSMVCIDELVASTERFSGIALVASTVQELAQRECSMFMATHLHELSKMSEITELPRLKIHHLEVHYDEARDILIYDRKLRDGSGSGLYGLEVAKYLHLDDGFMKRAFEIRNKIIGTEKDVFVAKESNYNSDVYLHKCATCGYVPKIATDQPLETHHINFQCMADAEGNFATFHKDVAHNLVVLCRKCHQRVHTGHIEIGGYVQTSVGIEIQKKEYVQPITTPEKADKPRTPFTNSQIDAIRIERTKLQTKKQLIEFIKQTYGIKCSYSMLNKILE